MPKYPKLNPSEIEKYYRSRVPKLRRQGAEYRGPCPIHEGMRYSLAINPDTGAAYCHSNCNKGWNPYTFEAALSGGDDKSAVSEVLKTIGRAPTNSKPRIVATYDYTDAAGKLLYQVCRYEPGYNGETKTFKARQPNGRGGWTYNHKGLSLVPYNLAAVAEAETVFIVEGEKDVETLKQWSLTGSCNVGGALKWRDTYAPYFEGKEIWILPDNDDSGRKHAQQVRVSLEPVAKCIRVLELPGLAAKGDITDWKFTGGTAEQLAEVMESLRQEEPDEHPQDITEPELSLFTRTATGIYWTDPSKQQHDLFLSPPLDVVALSRNFDGEEYGKLVQFVDAERQPRQAIIPHTRLMGQGNEALEQLVNCGFHPNIEPKAQTKLKQFVWWSRPKRKVRCVDQIGWKLRRFVFPDETIGGKNGSEEILFFSSQPPAHKLKIAGTLESWQEKVSKPCAGNSRLVFSIAGAFAAALLEPMQHECVGFHIRGLSSTGKTTALRVAGSVWGGGGPTGFLDTWRATANGLEAKAALHNHALLCLDEISQVAEKVAGEIVYFLGNGAAKSRMTKSITARATPTFRLIYLSTGERSLSELMRSAGQLAKAGQELRLAEISADAGRNMGIFEQLPPEFEKPDQFARALTHATLLHYGTPIRTFLRTLAPDLDRYTDEAKRVQTDFVRTFVAADASGEVYRLASTFGLIAGAGELATKLGITGWKEGAARVAIATCFVDWLEGRGGSGALDIEHGIRRLRDFLERHGAARFQDIERGKDDSGTPIRDRAGFKSREADGAYTWFIHEDVFRNEVCGPYDYRTVYRELIARELAPRPAASDRNLTQRKRVPGLGRARFYVVFSDIFSGKCNEDAETPDDIKSVGTAGTVGTGGEDI